jgi:predicted O-methyltransferase YrrM
MNIVPECINEFNNLRKTKLEHFVNEIEKIIIKSNETLEGNCFYEHQTLNRIDYFYNKQFNLFYLGSLLNINNICEIGFNAGHSCLLLLLGRKSEERLNYTIFDLNEHKYTIPCIEYISKISFNIDYNFIAGDSIETIPNYISNNPNTIGSFDLVHIDGGHADINIKNDFINADILVKNNGIIIIDDTDDQNINNYVEKYTNTGKYKEIFILPTYSYKHRIIQKI